MLHETLRSREDHRSSSLFARAEGAAESVSEISLTDAESFGDKLWSLALVNVTIVLRPAIDDLNDLLEEVVIQGRIDMVLNAGGRGGFVIVGRGGCRGSSSFGSSSLSLLSGLSLVQCLRKLSQHRILRCSSRSRVRFPAMVPAPASR